MDRRDLHCRGKKEYTTSHIRVGGLLWGSVEGHFLSTGIAKSDKDRQRVSSGQNTQENKESSRDQMARLSKQMQQLGECERSRVIFHVIILLLFLSGVLLMVFLMNEVETLSFWDDYLLVNNDINVTMKTSSSVWWRTVTVVDAHGVVQEVGFPKPKSSTSVKCYSFYPSFWLAFTTWPITKEINSSGWHYWVVVWAISYQIHPSNHEWFLSHVTEQFLHGLLQGKQSGEFYHPTT